MMAHLTPNVFHFQTAGEKSPIVVPIPLLLLDCAFTIQSAYVTMRN